MFLSFGTNRSGQTVQTQIRLLLENSLIRVYTVCHSICSLLMHFTMVKPLCSNFFMVHYLEGWVAVERDLCDVPPVTKVTTSAPDRCPQLALFLGVHVQPSHAIAVHVISEVQAFSGSWRIGLADEPSFVILTSRYRCLYVHVVAYGMEKYKI